jgi:hypothetical protein
LHSKKGVISMEYRKPELVVSSDAIRVIESHLKPVGNPDSPTSDPDQTSPAYEADE